MKTSPMPYHRTLLAFLVAAAGLAIGVPVDKSQTPFKAYNSSFVSIVGSSPSIEVLFNLTQPLFHEGAVYHPPTHSIFVATDTIHNSSIANNASGQFILHITGLNTTTPEYTILDDLASVLPNCAGGVRYLHNGTTATDLVAFACTGSLTQPGGIFTFDPYNPTVSSVKALTTSYGGYRYNFPDDLTALPNGDVYFTDPAYGFYNGYTPKATLPSQVYLYSAATNTTRVVADGFGRPNGITHSPDGKTIYIGDTGANIGNGTIDYEGQRSAYAYDVVDYAGQPFLTNRRVFAMSLIGAFDGLKTDTIGRVWGYAGSALGSTQLEIWSPGGDLLGTIKLAGEVGDMGFGESGEVYAMSGNLLFRINVDESVIGTGVFLS